MKTRAGLGWGLIGAIALGALCLTEVVSASRAVAMNSAVSGKGAVAEGWSALADDGPQHLTDDAPKPKVMCFWLAYSRQRYMCGEGSIDRVKKKCNEVASAEVGEPVECSCTDDPEYIKDSCD